MIFDPLIFSASLYSIIGAVLAAVWSQVSKRAPITKGEKARGFLLYFFMWPVMIALDVVRVIQIERKMRAAYRKKGML